MLTDGLAVIEPIQFIYELLALTKGFIGFDFSGELVFRVDLDFIEISFEITTAQKFHQNIHIFVEISVEIEGDLEGVLNQLSTEGSSHIELFSLKGNELMRVGITDLTVE